MNEILQYLKKHGEQLDTEIAEATGNSLTDVHLYLSHLVARGEIVVSRSIKFEKDKQIEGIICRIVGYIPPAAQDRKPKVQIGLSS